MVYFPVMKWFNAEDTCGQPAENGKYAKIGIPVLLCAIAALYIYSITSEPDLNPELNPDSSTFLVLAKSLASGQGYRNIDLVCNTPHGHFPFGFPALLMPLVYFFGFNMLILKGFVTLLSLCSFFCFALLLSRFNLGHIVPVLLLTMGSSWIFRFSHHIMSEIPYILFSLLTVYFLLLYKEQNGWLNRYGFLTVLFMVLACFTRTIGIGLVAAAVCALLFGIERGCISMQYKKAIFIIIGFGISALACRIATQGGFHASNGSYVNELFIDPYDPSGMANFSNLLQRLAHNSYALFFYGIPNVLAGMQFKGRNVISIVLAAFSVWGFAAAFKKNRSMIEWYMAGYLFILLIWPWTRNHGTRFLIPVIPFVFYYFLNGVASARNLIPSKRLATALYACLFALLIGSNALFSLRFIMNECGKPWSQKPSGKYIEMTAWVQKMSPPEAVFITWNTQPFYLWSQRKSVCLPGFKTTDDLEKILKGNRGSYLLCDPANDPALFQTAVSHSTESLAELYNKNDLKIYQIK